MSIPVTAPFTALQVEAWAPSDWQTRLPAELGYVIDRIGSGAVKAPVYANATARNLVITAATAGDVAYLTDAGSGSPALQIYNGSAWLDLAAGPPPVETTVEIPVYANAAARDAAVTGPAAGDLVYLTDAGAAAPAVQVYNGATWNAVWPAAASAAVVPTSLSSLWVNEPGVLGGDTPFVLGDWQDAATTGPNTCGATALALTLQRGCIRAELPSGAARFAAFGLPLPTLADGDEVCFRFLADFQLAAFDAITSSVSGTVFAGFFTSPGADTTWVGAGYLSTVNRIAAPTWGRWASTGPSPNLSGAANLGADSQSGAAAFQSRVFDVRARRVGATTRLYYAIDGGAWMTADSSTAATTANLASGTVRAGIRVATTSATATSAVVTLVAFKHFVGGLPAAIARG